MYWLLSLNWRALHTNRIINLSSINMWSRHSENKKDWLEGGVLRSQHRQFGVCCSCVWNQILKHFMRGRNRSQVGPAVSFSFHTYTQYLSITPPSTTSRDFLFSLIHNTAIKFWRLEGKVHNQDNPSLKEGLTSSSRKNYITIASLISVGISKIILSLTFMVPKSDYFILESKTYKH